MLSPEEEVEAMLAKGGPTSRNSICKNEPLSRAIQHFMKLLAEGKTNITLNWIYDRKLRELYAGPKQINTVKQYVRDVLKLDPMTGLPL